MMSIGEGGGLRRVMKQSMNGRMKYPYVKGQHVDYLGYTDFEVKVVNLIEFLWFVVIPILLFKREKSKNTVQGVEMQA